MRKKIAIVGAGPKAAGVTAKAAVLDTFGKNPPTIDIFEPIALAAAWTGDHGFTDGIQPLCTLAERDLGYPYDARFGAGVSGSMHANFSWQAFCVESGQYGKWITDGRNPPPHREFAEYVSWAIQKARASNQQAFRWLEEEVVSITFDATKQQWTVQSNVTTRLYDGVVITGSGSKLPPLSGANSRVVDGATFWSSLAHIEHLLRSEKEPQVVIIGAGGTAAAVAYWFIRAGVRSIPIKIVGREPTLYARRSNPFEDRYFTDILGWDRLPYHAKEAYLRRLTSGVVWESVLDNLRSDNIEYLSYDVRNFVGAKGAPPPGFAPLLAAELFHTDDPHDVHLTKVLSAVFPTYAPPAKAPVLTLPATLFVDARGFDRWGFTQLFTDPTESALLAPVRREGLLRRFDHSLALGGGFPPNMHVPNLASIQGPGASNLMSLGWVADRILNAYVP